MRALPLITYALLLSLLLPGISRTATSAAAASATPTLPVTPTATATPTASGALLGTLTVEGAEVALDAFAPQVVVRLTGPAGFTGHAPFSPDGHVGFEGLAPGIYALDVELPEGFALKDGTATKVQISAANIAHVDLRLVPGDPDATPRVVGTEPTEGQEATPPESPPGTPEGAAPAAEGTATPEATPDAVTQVSVEGEAVVQADGRFVSERSAETVESAEPSVEATVPAAEGAENAEGEPGTAVAGAESTPVGSEEDGEWQEIARASHEPLALRFAPGRDALAQVTRRDLGEGLVWLGVPFQTQIDGGEYEDVNCGPASLSMVLAAFGLVVEPSRIRAYLNSLTQRYNPNEGTSLDVLSAIAEEAGLVSIDLYGQSGGYRTWTSEGVRWHVEQGHPVITLVKYRDLPGHSSYQADTDHYIVITGLTPDGFIYNDAAYATDTGYGLEMSASRLEDAWADTSISRHGVALALPSPDTVLSFPEPAKPEPTPAPDPAVLLAQRAEALRLLKVEQARTEPILPAPAPKADSPVLPVVADAGERFAPVPTAATVPGDGPVGLQIVDVADDTAVSDTTPLRLTPLALLAFGLLWLRGLLMPVVRLLGALPALARTALPDFLAACRPAVAGFVTRLRVSAPGLTGALLAFFR